MLFYGPPGTGKTSTILATARQLYGPNLMKTRVLELNASDERGISIVREKVKNFARLTVSNPTKEELEKYPCPPYKLIILDEADCMTADAQSALRRTMETYSHVTRFCLICNYITRIITPVASRCSKFRFKLLDDTLSLTRLQHICQQEKVALSKENEEVVLKEVLRVSDGDLRKAITLLQSACKLFLAQPADKEGDVDMNEEQQLSIDSIEEISGSLPHATTEKLLKVMTTKDLQQIYDCLESEVFTQGYSGISVINAIHDKLLVSSDDGMSDVSLTLTNKQKNSISQFIFESDSRLSNGSDESLQILNMVIKVSSVL